MNQFLGNLKIENEQRYSMMNNQKMESKNKINEEFDEYDEELIGKEC
jgi:hypothetical protein